MNEYAVGLDIGGTKTSAGLVTRAGEVVARAEAPTPARSGSAQILATAVSLARGLMRGRRVCAAGVGSAGVIDRRRVVSATDQLAGWAGTELGMLLEAALGVPVVIDNDVHAHAVGEAFAGAGRGHGTILVVAVGTGIGGAVVVDGVPQSGAHGAAGHIGHIWAMEAAGLTCPCGRIGHLESISSGVALQQLYRRLGGDVDVADARAVVARTETDPLAHGAVTISARALGHALGGLVNVVDPDVLIVAGGMRNAGRLWWSTMEEAVRTTAVPLLDGLPVVSAQLGDDAAIIGAAHRAFESVRGAG